MPSLVLSEFKKHPFEITAISPMSDSGGSSGEIRKEWDVLPPGDIRRHLLALSNAPNWKKELFSLRIGNEDFGEGHRGHNVGNIIIGGMEHTLKDYENVIDELHRFLEVEGRCLPSTIEKTELVATLEDGTEIVGEYNIDNLGERNPDLRINKVFLRPFVKAYEPVLDSISEADYIIIGPGDLYSSLVPCILPSGISKAIYRSKAKKIFICPAMNKLGETSDYSVRDYTSEMERYLDCSLDKVIFNNAIPDKVRLDRYKSIEPRLQDIVSFNDVSENGKYIGASLLKEAGDICYDSNALRKILLEELGDERR